MLCHSHQQRLQHWCELEDIHQLEQNAHWLTQCEVGDWLIKAVKQQHYKVVSLLLTLKTVDPFEYKISSALYEIFQSTNYPFEHPLTQFVVEYADYAIDGTFLELLEHFQSLPCEQLAGEQMAKYQWVNAKAEQLNLQQRQVQFSAPKVELSELLQMRLSALPLAMSA